MTKRSVDGQWVHSWQYVYTYGAAKNLLSLLFMKWRGSQWVQADTYLSTMDGGQNPYVYYGHTATHTFQTLVISDVAAGERNRYTAFALDQNYPNPFNPTTKIGFTLPERARVTVQVFNILGQNVARVVESEYGPGHHRVDFDAAGLPSGVYLYRMRTENFPQTKRLTVVK